AEEFVAGRTGFFAGADVGAVRVAAIVGPATRLDIGKQQGGEPALLGLEIGPFTLFEAVAKLERVVEYGMNEIGGIFLHGPAGKGMSLWSIISKGAVRIAGKRRGCAEKLGAFFLLCRRFPSGNRAEMLAPEANAIDKPQRCC